MGKLAAIQMLLDQNWLELMRNAVLEGHMFLLPTRVNLIMVP